MSVMSKAIGQACMLKLTSIIFLQVDRNRTEDKWIKTKISQSNLKKIPTQTFVTKIPHNNHYC